MIIMCDIDGVICEPGRFITEHLHDPAKSDWKGYFEHTMEFDSVPAMITLIECLVHDGHDVHLVTGRPESNRRETTAWLVSRTSFFERPGLVHLHMRPNDCHWKGAEYKLGIAKKIKPDLIFDDELDTVQLFEAYGYTVLLIIGHRTETTRSDRAPD